MVLIILAQSSVSSKPSKGTFNNPATRQDLKSFDVIAPLDDRKSPLVGGEKEIDQLTRISTIRPNQFQTGQLIPHPCQEYSCTVTILNVCRMNHNYQYQSQRIDQQMTLAPVYFLASVVPVKPPFSVVFTDWLSTMAALGSASRRSWTRTSVRRQSWMCFQVPSFFQQRK